MELRLGEDRERVLAFDVRCLPFSIVIGAFPSISSSHRLKPDPAGAVQFHCGSGTFNHDSSIAKFLELEGRLLRMMTLMAVLKHIHKTRTSISGHDH